MNSLKIIAILFYLDTQFPEGTHVTHAHLSEAYNHVSERSAITLPDNDQMEEYRADVRGPIAASALFIA